MDRFIEMSMATEAYISVNGGEELAVESSGALFRKLQREKGVEEILSDFIKGMRAAGVEFDSSNAAKNKMKLLLNVKQIITITIVAQLIGVGFGSSVAFTVDGIPFVMKGDGNKIKGWFYCSVKIPGTSKSKIIKITTSQLAKMYSESSDGLDPAKVKLYGKNILKYAKSSDSDDTESES